jgi:hypothetical protein
MKDYGVLIKLETVKMLTYRGQQHVPLINYTYLLNKIRK